MLHFGMLQPFMGTLLQAGMACQGQTLYLSLCLRQLGIKQFYNMDTWCKCYETFFVISQSVCRWQAFPAYLGEVSLSCFSLGYAPGLTREHQNRLVKLARGQTLQLIMKISKLWRKKFHKIGPWCLLESLCDWMH